MAVETIKLIAEKINNYGDFNQQKKGGDLPLLNFYSSMNDVFT